MLIRKSKIQSHIAKAVYEEQKRQEDKWKKILERNIQVIKNDHELDIIEREVTISALKQELANLNRKIKRADDKYYQGKALVKKAKQIAVEVESTFRHMLDEHAENLQSFTTIRQLAEDTERKLLTYDED